MLTLAPENLIRAYMLANTPADLYKAIREDDYLASLLADSTTSELRDYLLTLHGSSDERAAVSGYAALIAMVLKDAPLATVIKCAEASGLDWAGEIVARTKASAVANTSTTFSTLPTVSVSDAATSLSTAASTHRVFANSATFR